MLCMKRFSSNIITIITATDQIANSLPCLQGVQNSGFTKGPRPLDVRSKSEICGHRGCSVAVDLILESEADCSFLDSTKV